MATRSGKGRSGARVFLAGGIALLLLGAFGGFGGSAIFAPALPLGVLLLIVALVLALRRRPDVGDRPPQDRAERRRAFAVRLLLLGLLLVPLSLVISIAAGNAAAAGIFIPPVVVAVALGVAVAASGRFFLGALILGALLTAFAFASFELELRHPESFGNFVPALWMTMGYTLAVAAAGFALVQYRRRILRPATTKQRAFVLAGLVLLVTGSAVSWFASGASRVTAAKAEGAPVVTMHDNEFTPNELDATAGRTARFYLVNEDSEPHTFTIDYLELDEYIGPLGERLVEFEVPSDAPRDMRLVCLVSGHEKMVGVVQIDRD